MFDQQVNRARPQLREQAIDPRDLVEVNAQQYGEIKMQGLSAPNVQRKLNSVPEEYNLNFDISFIPPKKENFAKTGVFFPMENQRYNDLNNSVTVLPQNQGVRKSYTSVPQYNNYNYIPQQNQVFVESTYTQPVVVNRIYQRSDGQVIQMPVRY